MDPRAAAEHSRWPDVVRFNWALDWFDAELAAGHHRRRDGRTRRYETDHAAHVRLRRALGYVNRFDL
jgi:hypothetical protein